MRKITQITLSIFASVFVLAAADTKPTAGTYITSTDVQETLKKAAASSVTDQQIRNVDVGKTNVAVGVVYRSPNAKQVAVEHDKVSEVYYIMEGSGTLVTGGTIVGAHRDPNDPALKLNGTSMRGTELQNGVSRKIGPGDVIVIPAGVGHWFSAVDKDLKYIIMRIDPEKVVPLK